MIAEASVDVVWGALESAWLNADDEELWVRFRPRDAKDVLGAVESAIEVADQVAEDAGWGDDVHAGMGAYSDAGSVVFLLGAEHEPGLRSWVGAFAHHLEGLGTAGMVTAEPEA